MDLMGMIGGIVNDNLINEISKKTGLNKEITEKLVSGALPMITGGLSKNANEHSDQIDTALDNHNDSVLSDIGSVVSNPEGFKGDKILSHILGSNEEKIETELGNKVGVEKSVVASVMQSLAPLVMGQLGSAKSSGVNVAGLLKEDTESQGFIASLIDRDGDGKISDDLFKMGGNFLKNKFLG